MGIIDGAQPFCMALLFASNPGDQVHQRRIGGPFHLGNGIQPIFDVIQAFAHPHNASLIQDEDAGDEDVRFTRDRVAERVAGMVILLHRLIGIEAVLRVVVRL